MASESSLSHALEVLRIDGSDNNGIVSGLLDAVPIYIEQATGITETEQSSDPLCQVVSDFLLQLWYMPEQVDTERMQKVIDSLLVSVRNNHTA